MRLCVIVPNAPISRLTYVKLSQNLESGAHTALTIVKLILPALCQGWVFLVRAIQTGPPIPESYTRHPELFRKATVANIRP